MNIRNINLFIYTLIFGILIGGVFAANYWVADPANCPATDGVNFPGQDCSAPIKICGDSGGIAQCYLTSTLTADGAATSNTDQDSGTCQDGTCNGGFIVNCYATADASSPYCDNSGVFWCDRNSSCYTTQVRDTACTASVFARSTCGNCRSGFQNCTGDDVCEVTTGSTNYPTGANNNYAAACACACDSSYLDCDVGGCGATNGCEQHVGSDIDNCAIGSNNHLTTCTTCVCDTGYQDCDSSGAGVGNGCEVQTGVTTCTTGGGAPGTYSAGCVCTALPIVDVLANIYNSSFGNAYIFGQQAKPTGNLLNLTNSTNSSLIIDRNACLVFPDTTSMCTASVGGTSLAGDGIYLYNDSTKMYQNETKLNTTTNSSIDLRVTVGFIKALGFNITTELKTYFDGLYQAVGNYLIIGSNQQVTIAGENITSGTVADVRIASTLTRDSELATFNYTSNNSNANFSKIFISSLTNCDTLNTTSTGELVCGTDANIGFSADQAVNITSNVTHNNITVSNNLYVSNNITVLNYTCFNAGCTSYAYHNGTALIQRG